MKLTDIKPSKNKRILPDPIKLNVGGVRYWTTYDTLTTRGPNFFTALLDHEASGKLTSQKDEKGFIFIDRSGKLFGVVLEFLRTGELFVPIGLTLKQVEFEFEFYQIPRSPPNDPLESSDPSDSDTKSIAAECKIKPTIDLVQRLYCQCKRTAWKWLQENEKFICNTIQKDASVGNFSTHKFWFVDEPGPNWSCFQNPDSTYDPGFLTPLNQCDDCFLTALSQVTYEKWGIYCVTQAERRSFKSCELQRNWAASWISVYFTWKELITGIPMSKLPTEPPIKHQQQAHSKNDRR